MKPQRRRLRRFFVILPLLLSAILLSEASRACEESYKEGTFVKMKCGGVPRDCGIITVCSPN